MKYTKLLVSIALVCNPLFGMEKEPSEKILKIEVGQKGQGKIFEITPYFFEQSATLRNLVQDLGAEAFNQNVPLPDITVEDFAVIVRTMHLLHQIQNNQKPLAELLNYLNQLNLHKLGSLLVNANYLDIPLLLQYSIQIFNKKLLAQAPANIIQKWQQLTKQNPNLLSSDIQNLLRQENIRLTQAPLYNNAVATSPLHPYGIEINPNSSPIEPTISNDNKHIAYADELNNIHVFNLATGEQKVLRGHTNQIGSLTFTPDSTKLFSAAADHTIRLWDLATEQEIQQTQDYAGSHLTVSNNGTYYAFVSQENRSNSAIEIVNLQDGSTRTFPDLNKEVVLSALSPNGQQVAIITHDNHAYIWSPRTDDIRDLPTDFRIEPNDIIELQFSPDGTKLFGLSNQSETVIWENNQFNVSQIQQASLNTIEFSPNGSLVAIEFNDTNIALFNVHTQTLVHTFSANFTEHSHSIEFTPDNKYLVATGHDNIVRIFDVDTGDMRTLTTPQNTVIEGAIIRPDSKEIAAILEDHVSNNIYIWDFATGMQRILQAPHNVSSITFAPDNKTLVSSLQNGAVVLWDLETNKQKQTMQIAKSDIIEITYTADDKKLFASTNTHMYLINIETGESRQINPKYDYIELPLIINTQSTYALVTTQKADYIRVWNLKTGTIEKLTMIAPHAHTFAISPNSKLLACETKPGTIQVFDLETRMPAYGIDISFELMNSFAFSNNNSALAIGTSAGFTLYWNLAANTMSIAGKSSLGVPSLFFNHNDTILAIENYNGDINLLNLNFGSFYTITENTPIPVNARGFFMDTNIFVTQEESYDVQWWYGQEQIRELNIQTGASEQSFLSKDNNIVAITGINEDGQSVIKFFQLITQEEQNLFNNLSQLTFEQALLVNMLIKYRTIHKKSLVLPAGSPEMNIFNGANPYWISLKQYLSTQNLI